MRINALYVARLCAEFRETLNNSEIVDLKKDEARKTVTIHLMKSSAKYCLIFHFGMSTSYLYYLDYFPHKIITTNFLPQLREARINHISQPIFDRVLRFDVSDNDAKYSLVFELFGPSSNLYLLDSKDKVITTLRKAKQGLKKYILPECQPGFNPVDFEIKSVIAHLRQNPEAELDSVFTALDDDFFYDLYESLNLDLSLKMSKSDDDELELVLSEINRRCIDFVNAGAQFYYQSDQRRVSLFERAGFERADSLSTVLAGFSSQEKQPVKKLSEKKRILEQIKRLLKRDSKKIENLKQELERAGSYKLVRKKAEVLSANLHRVKAGMESVDVPDYESGPEAVLTIELSRSLSPGRNVEHLFSRARKLQEKIPALDKDIKGTESRLSELNLIREKLELAPGEDVPQDIQAALTELGLKLKPAARPAGHEPDQRVPYRQYTTSLGDAVLVGKSASDNDQLTFKVARKSDLWFHSQQTAGSHVILRRPNRTFQFQKTSIVETAQIAAFFSTAKGSDNVPVIYTEARYVRKARKGNPGQVIADRTTSILVTPQRPKN